MKFKNAKIRMLDLDLKGCIYLNTFSRSKRVAHFFKLVSRLGDGVFWYAMLAAVWLLQGLLYGLQMLYLIISSLAGTGIYKVLKKKTVRLTAILGYVQPLLLILMLPFTVLVALSRMVLGLHYPSDVAVGAMIGGAVAGGIVCGAPLLNIVL